MDYSISDIYISYLLFQAYAHCCVVVTVYMLVVNVIVSTGGRVVNVMWLRQTASIQIVMAMEDAEKAFVSVWQDGQEKVVTFVSFQRFPK